jgi:hypothetical protein
MKTVTCLSGLSALALLLSSGGASVATCNLPLPCDQTVSSSNQAIIIANSGSGTAIQGISWTTAAPPNPLNLPIGVSGWQGGFGIGVEGESRFGVGVRGRTGGSGDGVLGVNYGSELEGHAATFVKGSVPAPGTLAAVQVRSAMVRGEAAWLETTDASNSHPVIKLLLASASRSNFLECHRPDFSRKCRINRNGSFVSGSDFAEALPVVGDSENYEPGDVLVLAEDGSGVEKSSEPSSRRIVGVYSTRPAILGADKEGDTRVDSNDIPVAILGIVPTKVTTENGPIRIGDLLVTASTPAHATKAKSVTINDAEIYPTGAILGKALEPLQKTEGVIKVLVMLR